MDPPGPINGLRPDTGPARQILPDIRPHRAAVGRRAVPRSQVNRVDVDLVAAADLADVLLGELLVVLHLVEVQVVRGVDLFGFQAGDRVFLAVVFVGLQER